MCENFHSSFCAYFVLLIVATQTPSVFSQQKIHNEIDSFMFFYLCSQHHYKSISILLGKWHNNNWRKERHLQLSVNQQPWSTSRLILGRHSNQHSVNISIILTRHRDWINSWFIVKCWQLVCIDQKLMDSQKDCWLRCWWVLNRIKSLPRVTQELSINPRPQMPTAHH